MDKHPTIIKPLLICILLLVLITGVRLQVPGHGGMVPENFWRMKQDWKSTADIVVAGDSRIYRGISPQAMNLYLPDFRILNFGFSACGFSRPYLEAAAEVLDPDSPHRIIVLGITPYSLTSHAGEQNQFTRSPNERNWRPDWLNRFIYILRPVDRDDLAWIFSVVPAVSTPPGWYEKVPKLYYNYYHEDGWVASSKVPEEPDAALSSYGRVFSGNTVSGDVIRDLAAWIREMTRQNIQVFAFRVPSSEKMVALENHISGFNEPSVRRAVDGAGGVWLNIDQTRYPSYDGSHLREDAARDLSYDLSEQIAFWLGFRP